MKDRKIIERLMFFVTAAAFALITGISVQAQIIAFDTNGLNGDEPALNSTTTAANLNASVLTRGAGINASANQDSFNSNSFNSATISEAITANEFLQFTVSPQAGFRVSLSTLNANFRRSGTGPSTFQFQYSLDGFTTAGINIGSSFQYSGVAAAGAAQPQINLSTIAALQNVASPNIITIRLYAAGASSTAGAFGIGELAGNDLAIGGTVTAVTTAAPVQVGGRVTQPSGRGILNAGVTMTDFQGNVQTTLTDMFGRFRFNDVAAGQTYIISVSHRRYQFEQPMQIQFIVEEIGDIHFIGIGGMLTPVPF